jgi:hypothetical protein
MLRMMATRRRLTSRKRHSRRRSMHLRRLLIMLLRIKEEAVEEMGQTPRRRLETSLSLLKLSVA